ncbi:RNA-directed DNA polymerase, eukaryota, reverse transcriptase zinc-binding domain protein [Tanacetum coccineum]
MPAKKSRSKRKIHVSNNDEQAEVRVSDLGEKESKGEEEEVEICNDELVWENHDVTNENGGEKGDHGEGKSPTVSPNNGKTQESSNVSENVKVSYAKMITSNDTKIDKTLCYIPTTIGENGSDVAIFDEDLVKSGSAKWNLTVCCYFVGTMMNFYELRYNLRKIFGKQSWLVGGWPLLVQKWSPDVSFERTEPDNIPLWIKMFDIPLEAWSAKGISTLASSLVEVNAGKEFKDVIEVQYKENDGMIITSKKIKVEYSWKPAKCSHCNVFRHNFNSCKKRPRTAEEMTKIQEEKDKIKKMADEFVLVGNKVSKQTNEGKRSYNEENRFDKTQGWNRQGKNNNKQEYKTKTNTKFHALAEFNGVVGSVWGKFADARLECLRTGDIQLLLVAFNSQLKIFHPLENNNASGEHP